MLLLPLLLGQQHPVWYCWFIGKNEKNTFMKKMNHQQHTYELSNKKLIFELFSSAGPFVIVGIAIPLYQLVDQFTFNRAMVAIGEGKIAELALAAINLYGHKLVIIPVTIATGLSIARSEEHTSELQSRGHLVCRLLLEK